MGKETESHLHSEKNIDDLVQIELSELLSKKYTHTHTLEGLSLCRVGTQTARSFDALEMRRERERHTDLACRMQREEKNNEQARIKRRS